MLSQGYLFDTQLCIAVLWLLYVTLLHRRIPMGASRIYLLSLLPVAMLLPLLRIPLLPAPELVTTERLSYILIEDALPATPVTAPSIIVEQILRWIYPAGILVFGIIAGIGILRTWIRTRRAEAEIISGSRVIFSGSIGGAYSVFGTVYVNDKYKGSPLLGPILAHEQSHLRYCHSADLVWISLWHAILWFNPLVWHLPRLLRQVHEFQADRAVIRQGNPVGPYVELLINAEAGIYPAAADTLCYSLTKKRLKMITQAKRGTSIGGYLRLATLLPVTGALLCAFCLTARAAEPTPALVVTSAPNLPESSTTATAPDTLKRLDLDVKPATDTLKHIDLDITPVKQPGTDIQVDALGDTTVRISVSPQARVTISGREIDLRGIDSELKPLIVIDGVISRGVNLIRENSITPDNYKSITVLKGAAATAAYGDMGKNGAIVITTNTDKSSEQRKKDYNQEPSTRVSIKDGPYNLFLTFGIIRINDEIVAQTDYGDESKLKRVNVTLTKKEVRNGVTISDKLLAKYPDDFFRTQSGNVVHMVPVSIRVTKK